MKITGVNSVIPLECNDLIAIECIHENAKHKSVECRYEIFILNKKNEQIAYFKSKHYILVSGIDKSSNLFTLENIGIECNTDQIQLYRIEENNTYTYLNTYEYIETGIEDGYFAIKRNGLYGFINSKGEEIIEPQYEKYRCFQDGLASVRKNHKWGVINKNNDIIVPFKYCDCGFFKGDYAVMQKQIGNYKTTDVYNTHGEIVYKVKESTKVFNLGNGTLLVKNKSNIEYEFVKLEE